MSDDPFKEASKFHTACRRHDKWRDDYVAKIREAHAEKIRAERAKLSPAAARVVEAAQQTAPPPPENGAPAEEPQISPRLLENPPDVGKPVVVEDKPARVRR